MGGELWLIADGPGASARMIGGSMNGLLRSRHQQICASGMTIRPERFDEFFDRYEQELTTDDIANEALARLADEAQKNRVTIMTATRDVSMSHLNLLASVLAARAGAASS